MELPFFKRKGNEPKYGEEEAMEIVRNIKVKFFPPKKHIYLPQDTTSEMFFILRGKVLCGVASAKDKNTHEILPDKYVERKQRRESENSNVHRSAR